ncbi:MAG TPA: hypothetical protein VFR37_05575, partial [Longimicrobium sp.]|nr:hypothetical protein [Longimicrobium sp.]
PQVRDEVAALLTDQLRRWAEQDGTMNAFLIADLLDLPAVEAAPVMREAFEAGAVDESVAGDWENVQVALGLLDKRTTPPPRFQILPPSAFRDFEPASGPSLQSTRLAAKARNRRKMAKQSRKKNRRRR